MSAMLPTEPAQSGSRPLPAPEPAAVPATAALRLADGSDEARDRPLRIAPERGRSGIEWGVHLPYCVALSAMLALLGLQFWERTSKDAAQWDEVKAQRAVISELLKAAQDVELLLKTDHERSAISVENAIHALSEAAKECRKAPPGP